MAIGEASGVGDDWSVIIRWEEEEGTELHKGGKKGRERGREEGRRGRERKKKKN